MAVLVTSCAGNSTAQRRAVSRSPGLAGRPPGVRSS